MQIETKEILLIQDTTAVSFGNRRNIEGMGYYCDSAQKGMLVHSCIAVTDTGLPVGLIFQEISTRSTRKNETQKTKEQRKFRPIEEKENVRWIHTIRECNRRVPQEINRITICDREGDFYELFAEAEHLKEHFLVRLTHNRMTEDGKRLFAELKQSKAKGNILLQIGRNVKEHIPSQKVNMEYHYEQKEISGELFLEKQEWKVLYCAAKKTPYLPEGNYTVYDIVLHLAMLGGRKGAPSDGMPGVQAIWKGLKTLYILLAYQGFLK